MNTIVYLIRHSEKLGMQYMDRYYADEDYQITREKRILSAEGEKKAKLLSKQREFNKIDVIYSSSYVRTIQTAKYFAERLDKKIHVDRNLNERKYGNPQYAENITLKQYYDENIKNIEGESRKEVTERMYKTFMKVIGENKGFKPLNLKLLFEGSTRNEVNNKISRFMAQVSECDIKFKNLEHYYHCYYESSNREESKIDEWLFVNLNFICYEYAEEKKLNFNSLEEFTINNDGTDITPAILEITPNVNLADITLEGLADDPIIIKNLTANKTVVLDGELQKVTVDGMNKYGDTDMWDFPRLNPGTNNYS